jgi:hypothetical protein
MKTCIAVIQDKAKKIITFSFREDGVEVDFVCFSTFNAGNQTDLIVGPLLGQKIREMKERGWTSDTLDRETFEHFGEFFI